ncbi:MAG: rod shape-determining protein MreC [Bacteriovoracaceae bacterium]|nr:rod shape-determining protein MreC [Bacteriovoracaceae bacterium]
MLKISFSQSLWAKIITNALVLAICLYHIFRYPMLPDTSLEQGHSKQAQPLFKILLMEIVSPIQSALISSKQSIANRFQNYVFIANTIEENRQLKQYINVLQGSLSNLNEVSSENQRLKQLLSYTPVQEYKKIMARVIAWNISADFRIIRIDKGSLSGIKKKQIVVTDKGLVGYVSLVSQHFADVVTILNSGSKVDILLLKSRIHGILEGSSKHLCSVKYVSNDEIIEIGEEVFTAGLSRLYPKDIPIGVVSKVERSMHGITQSILVKPHVNFSKLEEVLILSPLKENIDIDQLTLDKAYENGL